MRIRIISGTPPRQTKLTLGDAPDLLPTNQWAIEGRQTLQVAPGFRRAQVDLFHRANRAYSFSFNAVHYHASAAEGKKFILLHPAEALTALGTGEFHQPNEFTYFAEKMAVESVRLVEDISCTTIWAYTVLHTGIVKRL